MRNIQQYRQSPRVQNKNIRMGFLTLESLSLAGFVILLHLSGNKMSDPKTSMGEAQTLTFLLTGLCTFSFWGLNVLRLLAQCLQKPNSAYNQIQDLENQVDNQEEAPQEKNFFKPKGEFGVQTLKFFSFMTFLILFHSAGYEISDPDSRMGEGQILSLLLMILSTWGSLGIKVFGALGKCCQNRTGEQENDPENQRLLNTAPLNKL